LEFRLAAIDPDRDLHKLDALSIGLEEVETAAARWFDLSAAA
jgi:hypothetical protein